MTIDWFSFFLGAPVWGSLGVVVFMALLAAAKHVCHVRSARRAEGAPAPRRGWTADASRVVERPVSVRARSSGRTTWERRSDAS